MTDPAPGTRLAERYQLREELGRGLLTTTWAAVDRTGGGSVVVKQLVLSSLRDWKVVELFEREARLLRGLQHPAIPRYVDSFTEEQDQEVRLVLVQEQVAGEELGRRLARGDRLTEPELRILGRQVLEVLVYLHEQPQPVIHRDIKPSNLVLRPDGQVALVDFGAAAEAVRSSGAGGSTIVGTYGYMPPEQFLGKALPATDLYGLGCTLIHLATGQHPAELPTRKLKVDFRGQADLSAHFARWLGRLVEPEIARRPSSAREALTLLEEVELLVPLPPGGVVPASAPAATQTTGLTAPALWPLALPNPVRGSLIEASRSGPRELVLRLPMVGLSRFEPTLALLLAVGGVLLLVVQLLELTPPLPWYGPIQYLLFGSVAVASLATLLLRSGRSRLQLTPVGLELYSRLGPLARSRQAALPVVGEAELSRGGLVIPLGARSLRCGWGLATTERQWVQRLWNDHLARLQARPMSLDELVAAEEKRRSPMLAARGEEP